MKMHGFSYGKFVTQETSQGKWFAKRQVTVKYPQHVWYSNKQLDCGLANGLTLSLLRLKLNQLYQNCSLLHVSRAALVSMRKIEGLSETVHILHTVDHPIKSKNRDMSAPPPTRGTPRLHLYMSRDRLVVYFHVQQTTRSSCNLPSIIAKHETAKGGENSDTPNVQVLLHNDTPTKTESIVYVLQRNDLCAFTEVYVCEFTNVAGGARAPKGNYRYHIGYLYNHEQIVQCIQISQNMPASPSSKNRLKMLINLATNASK